MVSRSGLVSRLRRCGPDFFGFSAIVLVSRLRVGGGVFGFSATIWFFGCGLGVALVSRLLFRFLGPGFGNCSGFSV